MRFSEADPNTIPLVGDASPLVDLVIDLGALAHNYRQLRGHVGPGTRIMGVVKADAYGHGLVPVSRTLVAAGADCLGVAYLEEGQALRRAGLQVPVVLLMGLEPATAAAAVGLDLEVVIFRRDVAAALAAQARAQGKQVRVHLKVETGMGRLGIGPADLMGFLDWLAGFPELALVGLTSHFAVADWGDKAYTLSQLAQFDALIQTARARGWALPCSHIANSAAILDVPATHREMVRAGIMLYGSPPSAAPPPIPLRPVMSFYTRVLQLKHLPPGSSISYGCTYVAPAACTIAVLPVGYCRGYNRLLSNHGEVLLHGCRAPIRGRVCMNLTMVEVTHIPGVQEGDMVTLLGRDGDACLTADDLAGWAGTINYEIHCLLGNSNPRRYLGI